MIEIDKRQRLYKKFQTFLIGLLLMLWFFVISSYSFQPAELSTSNSKPIAVAGVRALKAVAKAVSKVEPKVSYLLIHQIVRKTAHVVCFTIFGFLSTMLAVSIEKRKHLAILTAVLLYGLCGAITDEVSQFFVPARNANVIDVFVDFTGVCVGYMFFRVVLDCLCRNNYTGKEC